VVSWRSPAQVARMQALADGYQLVLDDGSELVCSLAIMAEGGRSGLREQLGIDISTTPYGQSALIANVSPQDAHSGLAFERFTEEGPMAMLPLADHRCALVWTRATLEAERLMTLDDAAFLAELQRAFGYRLGSLRQVGTRYLYPLALTAAKEQVRQHLVVLGNAAHSLHPIAGQGFNLSLRDTWVLAETLRESTAPLGDLATLKRYLSSQQSDQQLTVGFSDQVTRLFSTGQPLLAAGRTLGLLGLDLLPPAKRWFARQAMGLGTRSEP
jgi:2-octaprenyl-6-methoxyphenol hydroxylase